MKIEEFKSNNWFFTKGMVPNIFVKKVKGIIALIKARTIYWTRRIQVKDLGIHSNFRMLGEISC